MKQARLFRLNFRMPQHEKNNFSLKASIRINVSGLIFDILIGCRLSASKVGEAKKHAMRA